MTNNENAVLIARELIIQKGSRTLLWLLQGTDAWEKTPKANIPQEHIGTSLMLAAAHPESMSSRWVDTQRTLCQTLVTILVEDLCKWAAANDRPDLFATVAQLVEEAVLASDEP